MLLQVFGDGIISRSHQGPGLRDCYLSSDEMYGKRRPWRSFRLYLIIPFQPVGHINESGVFQQQITQD